MRKLRLPHTTFEGDRELGDFTMKLTVDGIVTSYVDELGVPQEFYITDAEEAFKISRWLIDAAWKMKDWRVKV